LGQEGFKIGIFGLIKGLNLLDLFFNRNRKERAFMKGKREREI